MLKKTSLFTKTGCGVGLVAALLSSTTTGHAIGIRSDGQYSGGFAPFYDVTGEYGNVANIMKYDHVGGGEYAFTNSCTATLINSRTLITAAHCIVKEDLSGNEDVGDVDPSKGGNFTYGISFRADSNKRGRSQSQATDEFRNNEDESLISGFVAHQGYSQPPNQGANSNNSHDIAIISLDKPILDIDPAKLLSTLPLAGSEITLVGYGRAGAINVDVEGTGSDKRPSLSDDRRRVGGNYLESSGPLTPQLVQEMTGGDPNLAGMMLSFETGVPMLIFDSDDPANPRDWLRDRDEPGDRVHALEATTAPGDSGGPMFVTIDGVRYLVGLSNSGGPRIQSSYDGGYANIVFHASVAAHMDWIDKNNPLKETSAKAGSWNWSDISAWNGVNTRDGMQAFVPNNSTTTQCHAGEKGFCKHSTYFNVTLDQNTQLTVDRGTAIDKLTINNANASVALQSGQTLQTHAGTFIKKGQFHLASGAVLNTLGLGVEQSGTLVGHGRINGQLVSKGMINLAGDMSEQVGQLQVKEDISLMSGSVFRVRMNENGQTDSLHGEADISLNNARVVVSPTKGFINQRQSSVIVQSQSSRIDGAFSAIESSSAFYQASLTTASDQLSISAVLERDMTGASRKTKQTRIMALLTRGLDQNSKEVQELFTLIHEVSEDKLDQTLASLNGAVYGNNNVAMLANMNAISVVLGQLRQSSGGGVNSGNPSSFVTAYTPSGKDHKGTKAINELTGDGVFPTQEGFWSGWGKVLAGRGTHNGKQGVADTNTDTYGIMAGGFYTFADQSVLGFYGGVTTTASSKSGDSVDVESRVVGLNGETELGSYTVGGHLQYGHQSFKSSRAVAGGAIASGRYDGHIVSGLLEVSRSVPLFEQIRLVPFASVEAHHSRIDGFSETGAGAANLTIRQDSDTKVFSTIGTRFEHAFETGAGTIITPQISLGWRAELSNPGSSQTATLAGQTLRIEDKGATRHSLSTGLGLSLEMKDGPIVNARYDGLLSSSQQDHLGSLRITFPFK